MPNEHEYCGRALIDNPTGLTSRVPVACNLSRRCVLTPSRRINCPSRRFSGTHAATSALEQLSKRRLVGLPAALELGKWSEICAKGLWGALGSLTSSSVHMPRLDTRPWADVSLASLLSTSSLVAPTDGNYSAPYAKPMHYPMLTRARSRRHALSTSILRPRTRDLSLG